MAYPEQFGSRGNLWAMLREAANFGLRALMPYARDSGKGLVGNIKMTYDFAVDGGAIGTITPVNSPSLPPGAIIIGGFIDVTTEVTSGGAATIALGLGSGAQAAALKVAQPVANFTLGHVIALVMTFNIPTNFHKVTVEAPMTLTVAAFPLTAGRFCVNINYVMSNVV